MHPNPELRQRDGTTSRARRALATLQAEPCPDTFDAARRALVRVQRIARNPREAQAVRHALAWLELTHAVPPEGSPIIGNVRAWLDVGFPLQTRPAPIGSTTRRTHGQRCSETGQTFASFADAMRVLGISRGDMAKYRNGSADNAGGFTFLSVPLAHAANDSEYRKL